MHRVPRRGRAALLVALVVACGAVVGCGGSGGSSGGGTKTAGAPSGAGGAVVAQARKVAAMATAGPVWSAKADPVDAADIVPYRSWRGPTSAPPHKPGAKVEVILCTKQGAGCVEAGDGAVAAGKALGWHVDVIDGGGTQQGYRTAFDTALARNPDAIVGIAVPPDMVGDKIAEARKRGIVTVGAASNLLPGPRYDAYQNISFPLMAAVTAYWDIARTNGASHVIAFRVPAHPPLAHANAILEQVYKTCAGCSYMTVDFEVNDAVDATKVTQMVQGALARMPNATTIWLPFSLGIPGVAQALQAAGLADKVKIVAKDADPDEMKGLLNGTVALSAGASTAWDGWAAMDQVVRGLAKQPYVVGDPSIGISVTAFDKQNAPASANTEDGPGAVDFQSMYKKIWGVAHG